jgi:hypothetical protein
MEITSIASMAIDLEQTKTAQETGIAVMKKALAIQSSGALALLQALPPVNPANLPPHLGQHINTLA